MAQTPEEKAAAKAAKAAKAAAQSPAAPETEAPAETAPAAPAKPAKAPTGPITVKYRDHKGEPTERTFSPEVHGEDFAKLADEFKATNADKLIA